MDVNTTPRKRALSIDTDRKTSGRAAIDGERPTPPVEEQDEPLSPAAQLFHNPGFNCFIVVVMGSGRPFDVGVIKSGLDATLACHPRFRCIPIFDGSGGTKQPRWVPTKVRVEDHIVIHNKDPNSAAVSPDQVVEDYVASLTSTRMDLSRPLWELHLLNFPTSKAAAVAVLRLHHSLGDGTSLMSLFLACTRKASDPSSLPSIPLQSRRPPLAQTLAAGARALTPLIWLWALLLLAWNTLIDVLVFTATAIFFKDTATPVLATEGVENRPKRIVHRTVKLNDIKDIKNTMNCTVNDVLVGITSAGLSRYLDRIYSQTIDKGKQQQLPSNIRLRSTVLVNLRPIPGVHELAELMEGKDSRTKWGNLIGYIILPFSIKKYKDPLDYIRKGKEIADRKKNSLEAILTYKSSELIVKCFGTKAAAALCHRVLSHATMSFSNMIGPVEEIAFCGHPLVYLAPGVYGHPQALTVHYQSYMNKMEIILTVDDEVIPNVHQLLDDFAESLQLIKGAIPRTF